MSSPSNPAEPLTIVIPMAGAGGRFARAGYADPKPLIDVAGSPMIKVVIDNLAPARPHRFVFVCQRAHVERFGLRRALAAWAPGSAVVEIDGLTEGAACTVLAAREHLGDGPLLIANSDQYIDASIDAFLDDADARDCDGLIMTMTADDPKWSFIELAAGRVTRVVEKQVISDQATVGIYWFRHGSAFVAAADAMIAAGGRQNGEFYVAPAYNHLIVDGALVLPHGIGSEGLGMYGLGTPADLELFLAHPISNRVRGGVVAVP